MCLALQSVYSEAVCSPWEQLSVPQDHAKWSPHYRVSDRGWLWLTVHRWCRRGGRGRHREGGNMEKEHQVGWVREGRDGWVEGLSETDRFRAGYHLIMYTVVWVFGRNCNCFRIFLIPTKYRSGRASLRNAAWMSTLKESLLSLFGNEM